jgi:Mce-associated membrane protein
MTTVTHHPSGRRDPASDDPQVADPTDAVGTPDASPDATGPDAGAPQPDAERHGQQVEQDEARRARTLRPTPRVLWALAAVLAVAAVVVAATLGRAAWQARQADESRAAALAAGRQIAVNFVTMRASSFDADTKRVLDEATGQFRTEYASTLAQLKPVVTANKTVSTVERAEASLVSSDDDSARVIVGVVAPTTNASTSTPEKKTYRLRLDLVRVGDAWKVNALDFVS